MTIVYTHFLNNNFTNSSGGFLKKVLWGIFVQYYDE